MDKLNQYGVPKFSLWIAGVIVIIGIVITGYAFNKNDDEKNLEPANGYSIENSKLLETLITSQDSVELQKARDSLAQNANSETVRVIANVYVKYNTQETGLIRSYLLGTLARVSSETAVPGLSDIVSNNTDDFSLKTSAAIALSSIGTPEAVQALVNAINKSSSVAFTGTLVESLAVVKNKDSFNDLVVLLNTNTNENIRRASATALGNISGAASVTALKSVQQKESSQTVKYAIQLSLNKLTGNTGINYVPQPVDSSVSLKDYRNSIYTIKYPSSYALEEKQIKSDGGTTNYILLKPITPNGISQAVLFVTPQSIEDLDFREGITTGPNYVATQKVQYGSYTGYVTIQAGNNGQESMMVQIFDRNNGYLIRSETSYTGADQKAKDNAIKITQDILNNFGFVK